MQAMQINSRGGELIPVVLDTPTAGPGELLVQNEVVGVNFADAMQIEGRYPREIPLPYVPGYEVAGKVIAVGDSVGEIQVGDRVAGLLPMGGGYAEFSKVSKGLAFKLPEAVTGSEGVALLTQGITAQIMVSKFVTAGDRVLVSAAAGGVGSIATQLCKEVGAEVIGAVSKSAKVDVLADLDVQALTYKQLDSHLKKFDVVLDSIGGAVAQTFWAHLTEFGRFVSYGNASDEPFSFGAESLEQLNFANQTIHFYGFTKCLERDFTLFSKSLGVLVGLLETGELKILAHPPYNLLDAATALKDMVSRNTSGKVVLKCGEEIQ